jgi:thioredoxin-like negative regulator of GroEL
MIYERQGNYKEAAKVFADVLDGRKLTEGADLRLQLAQLYITTGQKDNATKQLDIAEGMAYDDQQIHKQLMMLYNQAGLKDKAAKEAQWMKENAPAPQQQPISLQPVPKP